MAHTPKTTLYTIERTERKNPKDKKRIRGLPVDVELSLGIGEQPVFITSSRQLADKYQQDMQDLWGHICDYVVVAKEVRV